MWKKGQTGNPGGVPRAASQVALLARQYSVEAVETLYGLMVNSKTKPRDRAYCAMLILSWGIGRPKQEVRLKVDQDEGAAQRPEIIASQAAPARDRRGAARGGGARSVPGRRGGRRR